MVHGRLVGRLAEPALHLAEARHLAAIDHQGAHQALLVEVAALLVGHPRLEAGQSARQAADGDLRHRTDNDSTSV